MPQTKFFTISNMLILFSAFFTIAAMIDPNLYKFGMNSYYYDQGNYGMWFVQMFTSEFLHGGVFHLLMN